MSFRKLKSYISSFIMLLFMMLLVSACSFSPIYGDKSQSNSNIKLSYAEPNNRLEQIIYKDLAHKLGSNENENLLNISVSSSSRSVARSSNGLPFGIVEAVLTAKITLVDYNDHTNIIFSGTRSAATSYSTNGQIIADKKALEDAQEKAALELAQTIRLTIIGAVSANSSN